ncbi:hypothetical protein B0H13DRAFT_2563199 [Mycena leptocephala]|nr:hypothetical protein B0H13DRAFT_2563199 [Mycena leptocephala]
MLTLSHAPIRDSGNIARKSIHNQDCGHRVPVAGKPSSYNAVRTGNSDPIVVEERDKGVGRLKGSASGAIHQKRPAQILEFHQQWKAGVFGAGEHTGVDSRPWAKDVKRDAIQINTIPVRVNGIRMADDLHPDLNEPMGSTSSSEKRKVPTLEVSGTRWPSIGRELEGRSSPDKYRMSSSMHDKILEHSTTRNESVDPSGEISDREEVDRQSRHTTTKFGDLPEDLGDVDETPECGQRLECSADAERNGGSKDSGGYHRRGELERQDKVEGGMGSEEEEKEKKTHRGCITHDTPGLISLYEKIRIRAAIRGGWSGVQAAHAGGGQKSVRDICMKDLEGGAKIQSSGRRRSERPKWGDGPGRSAAMCRKVGGVNWNAGLLQVKARMADAFYKRGRGGGALD